MKNKNTAITRIALAVLFIGIGIGIGIMAIMTIGSAYADSKNTGTSTQQNSCGNDDLPLNISCQSIGSNVHGRNNAAVVNATQP